MIPLQSFSKPPVPTSSPACLPQLDDKNISFNAPHAVCSSKLPRDSVEDFADGVVRQNPYSHDLPTEKLITRNLDSSSDADQAEQSEREPPSSVGRAVEESNLKERRLSRLQSFQLWLNMFFMGMQLTLPYTLSVYIVRDFYKDSGTSEQVISQLTGLLAASQSFARSLTAYPWGMLSDTVGRKICIIVGTMASVVSLFGFGLSRSYGAAIAARSVPALLVGSPVALKSMIGDTCDQEGQANAMAIFNLGHGLGAVVGPILGGTLAYPCTRSFHLPSCGHDGLWRQRPYLLPCTAVCLAGVLALFGNILLLEETHPGIKAMSGTWWQNICSLFQHRGDKASGRYEHPSRRGDHGGEVNGGVNQSEEGRDVETGGESAALLSATNEDSGKSYVHQGDTPDTTHRWWKDKNVRLALLGSGMVAFLNNFLDESAPIFVSAPVAQGGLNMPLEEFTWPISWGGAALVLFSITLYPKLIKHFGALNLCRAGLLLSIPAAMLLPVTSFFVGTLLLEQVCLTVAVMVKSIAKVCALNSSMIAVNLVAPQAKLGAVNGGAMMLQSGGRALGPLLSGTMWAITVSLHFSGQQFIGFVLLATAFAATQFLYVSVKLPQNS